MPSFLTPFFRSSRCPNTTDDLVFAEQIGINLLGNVRLEGPGGVFIGLVAVTLEIGALLVFPGRVVGVMLAHALVEFAGEPPMAALLPMSVAPRPPEVRPPRCLPGSIRTTLLPMRAVCTAAAMPPDVPPYTTTSYSRGAACAATEVRSDVIRTSTAKRISFLLARSIIQARL